MKAQTTFKIGRNLLLGALFAFGMMTIQGCGTKSNCNAKTVKSAEKAAGQ